jgi:hypothetical protein
VFCSPLSFALIFLFSASLSKVHWTFFTLRDRYRFCSPLDCATACHCFADAIELHWSSSFL